MNDMLYTRSSFTARYPLDEADVCFLGIPFDSTALAEGNQRFGPVTVRQALKTKVSYVPDKKKNPLKDLKISDIGDIEWVPGCFDKTSERIKDTVCDILDENSDIFFVFIGGEHSITLPIVQELEPSTVVQMDAHLDMAKDYQGNKFSHNTWASNVSEDDTEVIRVGCRSYTEDQETGKSYMDEDGVKKDIREAKGPIYLTVDMDVFDPSFAPDVGFPEEDGMSPREVFSLIDVVFEKEVVGMDLCEVASKRLNNRTAHLAAKTILHSLSNLC